MYIILCYGLGEFAQLHKAKSELVEAMEITEKKFVTICCTVLRFILLCWRMHGCRYVAVQKKVRLQQQLKEKEVQLNTRLSISPRGQINHQSFV